MACRERGMALVSVLLILAVLLTLGHILAEKVWQSTRQTAAAAGRAQLFWAAQAGIAEARRRLAADYAGSSGWRDFLADGEGRAYPAAPAWTNEFMGRSVEVFVRDNLDGDGDARRDNDLRVFVLARVRGAQGGEVLIECLCCLDPPLAVGDWPQGGPGVADLPVSSFDIGDRP